MRTMYPAWIFYFRWRLIAVASWILKSLIKSWASPLCPARASHRKIMQYFSTYPFDKFLEDFCLPRFWQVFIVDICGSMLFLSPDTRALLPTLLCWLGLLSMIKSHCPCRFGPDRAKAILKCVRIDCAKNCPSIFSYTFFRTTPFP